MLKKNISLSLLPDGRIPYLSELMPSIPDNVILCKTLPGLGATYSEIKTPRHSIIIEANKPVIYGKEKKHRDDNLFGVYKDVKIDDVVDYLTTTLIDNKYIKIMVTPESFFKVQRAMNKIDFDMENNVFLLFDECHKIITDVDYRQKITIPFDSFFNFRHKALVSATPLEFSDKRFEEQSFTMVKITPTFDCGYPVKVVKTYNTFKSLVDYIHIDETPVFIFMNSTDLIASFINQMGIKEESSIYCSDDSVTKLKGYGYDNAYGYWDIDTMKKYNFLTSRFYSAVDMDLDFKPVVIALTDCIRVPHTKFDPKTDLVQIGGRFRNGLLYMVHITNFDKKLQSDTRAQVQDSVKHIRSMYQQFLTMYETAGDNKGLKSALSEYINAAPYNNFLDENNNESSFAIDNYVENKMLDRAYCSYDYLKEAYSETNMLKPDYHESPYEDIEFEQIKMLSMTPTIKERRIKIVEQLELLGACETQMEQEYREKLHEMDSLIVEAYDILGLDEIERLNYNQKKIKEALIMHEYQEKKTGTEVIKLVKNSFQEGKQYKNNYIKNELIRIFELVGIKPYKAITAKTIDEYFVTKEYRDKNGRYHIIYESKF